MIQSRRGRSCALGVCTRCACRQGQRIRGWAQCPRKEWAKDGSVLVCIKARESARGHGSGGALSRVVQYASHPKRGAAGCSGPLDGRENAVRGGLGQRCHSRRLPNEGTPPRAPSSCCGRAGRAAQLTFSGPGSRTQSMTWTRERAAFRLARITLASTVLRAHCCPAEQQAGGGGGGEGHVSSGWGRSGRKGRRQPMAQLRGRGTGRRCPVEVVAAVRPPLPGTAP